MVHLFDLCHDVVGARVCQLPVLPLLLPLLVARRRQLLPALRRPLLLLLLLLLLRVQGSREVGEAIGVRLGK